MKRNNWSGEFCKNGHNLRENKKTYKGKSRCIKCDYITRDKLFSLWKKEGVFSKILRTRRLKSRYGLTDRAFMDLFKSQGRKCAICKGKTHKANNWVVDHCHKTGGIRGILCGTCNTGIGHLNDNLETVKEAAIYLEKYARSTKCTTTTNVLEGMIYATLCTHVKNVHTAKGRNMPTPNKYTPHTGKKQIAKNKAKQAKNGTK